MAMISVVTVVPKNLLHRLKAESKITNFPTLKGINKDITDKIKDRARQLIGYDSGPIACVASKVVTNNIDDYISINIHESAMLALSVDDDMIISVSYGKLLDLNSEYCRAEDSFEKDLILEELQDSLKLGVEDDDKDLISFIPFVDFKRCKSVGRFDDDLMSIRALGLPEMDRCVMKELISFFE